MITHINETDSTNSYIRTKISEGDIPHGYAVSTDYQHNGHGQKGNYWESERGKNILMSIFIRPLKIKPENQFIITQLVTIAITNVINKIDNLDAIIKWPNDIYVGDKKLAGILIENSIAGDSITETIIGIGLNVNQTDFVSDAPNPTSIKQITGKEFDHHKIADEIYNNILTLYSTFENNMHNSLSAEELHKGYMKLLYRGTGTHKYQTNTGEIVTAEIISIDSYGILHLKHSDNTIHSYGFKEIKFVI